MQYRLRYYLAGLPRRLGGGPVLRALGLLRSRDLLRRSKLPQRALPGAFIENQRDYGTQPFGRSTVREAGCEAIAAYNALLALRGESPPLEELIEWFRRRGMVLFGCWGTAPQAICALLRKMGLRCVLCAEPGRFESLAAEFPVLILTCFNSMDDLFCGIHTVCVIRDERGYVAHNALRSTPTHAYPTLSTLMSSFPGGPACGIALIGVGEQGAPCADQSGS